MSHINYNKKPKDKDYLRRRALMMAKRTQVEMLRDRGFDITSNGEVNLLTTSIDDMIAFYSNLSKTNNMTIRETLSRGYKRTNIGGSVETIYVYYIPNVMGESVKTSEIGPFIDIVDKYSYNSYILITGRKLTPVAHDSIRVKSKRIEVFMEDELNINPTKHVNVPRHEPISDQEQAEILKRNNWNIIDIPKLQPQKIIARYYGFKSGQMIRIHRFNPISGTMVDNILFYRVIPDPSMLASLKAAIIEGDIEGESEVDFDTE